MRHFFDIKKRKKKTINQLQPVSSYTVTVVLHLQSLVTKMAANRAHAVMVSFLFQGHITPFIHLAIKLASKGCTVTFVQTEFLHHRISTAAAGDDEEREIPEIILGARESGLDIRYATISDGFPLKFDREANFEEFWGSILRDFPGRVDEFLGRITAAENCDGGVPPSFLVADTTYLWASEIAHKYNMFSVSFWTEAALAFSVGYHLDLLKLNAHFPIVNNGEKLNLSLSL
ncbi:PREDICTED: UDP-glycosyltransferase 86A2-like [Erythranthe guttata]|uniref:UDP-glycosyltransferase 86A2-like n=1 Tax=Erythranthe guttata TaxID=4155 RepID=UPI00064D8421|nr:PREDICTED: UDP-glycosyltransferase 86A2-like [Erythranthe guttata]|eukprot:XP_012838264.1 PREDICTED: UDP-glycosyltransferase 86A2-like [Erythranthe guttata]